VKPAASITRSKTLDILRAVAVVAVLGRHLTVCPEQVSPFLHAFTNTWIQGGYVGVDLFFVLSGFLISGLLFREHQKYGRISLKNFWIRRGLKIYPAFFVFILCTVLYRLVHKEHIGLPLLARELLFLQNYGPGYWYHTWSLAVEEHFYILLPIALVWRLHKTTPAVRSFDWIPRAFVGIALICLALRLWNAAKYPYMHQTHLFPTHLRIDSLACGVLVSYFYHYHRSRFKEIASRYKAYLLPLAICCFIPAFVFPLETTPFIYTAGLSVFWIGSALLLLCLVDSEPKNNPLTTAFAFAGSRSYSIYLWHMAMQKWVIVWAESMLGVRWNWYLYASSYLIGSVLIGICMSALVEYPILRIRDRLSPSRS